MSLGWINNQCVWDNQVVRLPEGVPNEIANQTHKDLWNIVDWHLILPKFQKTKGDIKLKSPERKKMLQILAWHAKLTLTGEEDLDHPKILAAFEGIKNKIREWMFN